LSCLTPRHFNLTADNPHVYLSAAETKNGKAVEQPLPPDLTTDLREFLDDKPPRDRVWPGTWWTRAADMIRIDLEGARVPFVIEGRDGPLYADLHALRHSFVALLDQSGASLREAMQLARHSDPKLTMRTYGRLRLSDLGNAVGRLPSLTSGTQSAALSLTGTEGRHVPKHVPVADSGRGRLMDGEVGKSTSPLPPFSENPEIDSERGPLRVGEGTPRGGLNSNQDSSNAATLDATTNFDTSGFTNPIAGAFGWQLDPTAGSLSLTYTPSAVPEPSTLVLVGVAAAIPLWRRRFQPR
jgi:Phage integrase family/PEP-CTERM motif